VDKRRLAAAARPAAAFAAALAVIVLALVTTGAPALAHNSLTGSSPKNGAVVSRPPASVRLTFLSRLDPVTTKVTLTDPAGASAAGGAPAYRGSRVTIPFRPGPAGVYTVAYEVRSSDGHPIKGRIRFTLTVGTTPAAVPTPAATPTSAPPTPAVATSPALDPLAGEDDGPAPWWPWVVGVVGIAGLAAGGIAVARHRRV
jgi:methionine-rich copper-binding protein CopC